MKTILQNQSRERKIIYFIIGLFVLNAFGMMPIGIIGAYTAPPMTITTTETLEDGTTQEKTSKIYYHEELSEELQIRIYEFFRYSLPVTMTGYFLVDLPEFSYDYVGVAVWGLSLVSIPVVIKFTARYPVWKRLIYAYLIAVQIAGMWALGRVNFECIPFIDYPIRPGPPCGI